MYCLYNNNSTEVICITPFYVHKVIKKENSKNTIIKYKFTKLKPKSFRVFDKVAPPDVCSFSCARRYKKADLCRSRITFYLNLKVIQWPWNMNLALRQNCSPVGTMSNKYTAKITVKMRKSKILHIAMKIWPWPRGQGQMVQWELTCIFHRAFQIIKPGVDISSNDWDMSIYVKMTLTSISRSLLRYFKLFLHRLKGPSVPLTNI